MLTQLHQLLIPHLQIVALLLGKPRLCTIDACYVQKYLHDLAAPVSTNTEKLCCPISTFRVVGLMQLKQREFSDCWCGPADLRAEMVSLYGDGELR